MPLLSGWSAESAESLYPATPLAQDYSVVFHNENPEYYVEGPGLVRQEDGTLIAVVPVVPRSDWSKERRADHSRTHILRSADKGKTWQELSQLPYYSAVPWIYKGVLYLFANKGGKGAFRNDDFLLLNSKDGGNTWSDPVTLFKGHFWNCHTAIVIRGDRLYWATDDLALKEKRGPVAISGDLSKDPMEPKNWRMSAPVPFEGVPEGLVNPKFAGLDSQYLEPNVIEVNGELRVFLAVKPKRQTTASLCAIMDLRDENDKLELKFTQYSPMPGGQLKFCVLWDDVSKMYWATTNLVVDSQGRYGWWKEAADAGKIKGESVGGNDRRFLVLLYSLDALNWFQAGCIAQAGKASQSFMYARPVIDGNDLAIICRSSIDAPNQHDADYATFHRVKDFRRLALNLVPAKEDN